MKTEIFTKTIGEKNFTLNKEELPKLIESKVRPGLLWFVIHKNNDETYGAIFTTNRIENFHWENNHYYPSVYFDLNDFNDFEGKISIQNNT